MTNKINNKWELRETFNSIRRFLCKDITEFEIKRLRTEFEYALDKLNKIEEKLKENV